MKIISFTDIRINMDFSLSDYETIKIEKTNGKFHIKDNKGRRFVADYLVIEKAQD